MPAVLVRDPRADGLGLLADLVAGLAVRGHSGHLDGCAVDDDLHLVDVVLAQAGVLQPDLVQCAGDGGEVLVDGASGFGGDHFRVGVAVHAVLLEFDRFRAVLQSALVVAAFLVGLPCKFGLVETGPVRPGGEIGVGVFRVPHVLAVVRVDARVCVRHVAWRVNGLPSAVGQVFEITIGQMVRQACVRVRDVLHAARGTGFGGFDGGGVVRGLSGRLVGVLVVVELVRFGEHDVVEQVAAGRVHAGYLPEREPGDGLACGDRVVADVVAEVVLAGLVAERVGRVRGDGGGLLADLVAVLVRAGAGHFDGLLVAGRAYHDLHLVEVDSVAARVVELDPVERAGRGGDVLVDRGVFLACAQFAHLGGFAGGLLEFDGVRALFGHGALCLGAGPAESGRVQSAGDVGPFGEVVSLSVADPLAAVAVDAGEVVLQALHARVFEVAVDEVVRQAVDELPWIRRGGRCRQARDGLADVGHADLVRVRGARHQEPAAHQGARRHDAGDHPFQPCAHYRFSFPHPSQCLPTDGPRPVRTPRGGPDKKESFGDERPIGDATPPPIGGTPAWRAGTCVRRPGCLRRA